MSYIASVPLPVPGSLFEPAQLNYCSDSPQGFVGGSLCVSGDGVFTFYKDDDWSEEENTNLILLLEELQAD